MTDHARELRKAADRLTAAHSARDAAILAAAADRMEQTAIATAVGLSRMQISRIIKAAASASEPVEKDE